MAGNLFFSGILSTLYCRFNFLACLFVLCGYIPSSALDTVLLVVLEHPSMCLAAVTCTVSSCFTNFAFPSHSSPAYSNLGTTTLIRIHILILVSSAGLLGSHPSCLLVIYPFLLLSLCVHSKSSLLRSLRQSMYVGLRLVVHLLPTSTRNYRIHLNFVILRIQLLRIFSRLLPLSIS